MRLKTSFTGPLFFCHFDIFSVKNVDKNGQKLDEKLDFWPNIFGLFKVLREKIAFSSKKSGRMAKYFFILGREKCSIINGLRALRPVVQIFFYLNAKIKINIL